MKKRILIPSVIVLATVSLTTYKYTKINNIKETLKYQLISQINNDIKETSVNSNTAKSVYTFKSNEYLNLDSSYLINIDEIYNEKVHTVKIDDSNYISYSFSAKVTFTKNEIKKTVDINSNIIAENLENNVKIKSTDDLQQDLLKVLIQIKKENFEDFSEELNNISLIYQNEELDIQLNYPDYYTYNTFKTQTENKTDDNVSFYMDSDKSSNYIQFTMFSKDSKNYYDYIDEFKKQGYRLEEKLLSTHQNLEFSVLTQSFTQNFKEVEEIIYVSKNKYKDIDTIIVTAKLDSSLLKTRLTEIDEIIKSLK